MLEFGAGTTSGTETRIDGCVGSGVFGTNIIGDGYTHSYETYAAPVETDETINYVTSFGIGTFTERMFSKPIIITIVTRYAPDAKSFMIKFYNKSNAVIGVLSTDIQESIIQEIEWEDSDSGVKDANVILKERPPFPIITFGGIGFEFGRSNTEVYRGYSRIENIAGTTEDKITLKCSGLVEKLKGISPNRTISGPADVGATAKDVYDTDIQPNTDIGINLPLFDTVTGVTHASSLEFAKDKADKVFQGLAKMAGAEAGVDGSGKMFFQVEDDEIVKVFFAGLNILEFDPQTDIEGVKNSIVVQRNQQDGSGKSGWTVANISQDATSQALYGFREEIVKVPGYFSDADAAIVGAAVLADKKDPKYTAKIRIPIESEDDLIPRGNHRFVAALAEYDRTITECDATTGWLAQGTGDLALSVVTDPIDSGSGALKMNWTSANGDRAEYTLSALEKKAKKLRIYIRGSKTGNYLTGGWGRSSWDENTFAIPINVSNQYIPVEIEIPAGSDIGVIAIRVDTTDPGTIYVDNVQAVVKDNRHLEMRMKRVRYRFRPGKLEAQAEFGEPPGRMQDFVKQLLDFAEKNDSSGEER